MRHTVITGAGSGIGRETALAFARLGHRLTLVDRDREAVVGAAAVSTQAGAADVKTIVADLSAVGTAARVIGDAWEVAPVDVLVSSAGVYPATPFLELDERTWDFVQHINTRTPTLLTVELAKRAVEAGRGASVVNISSGAALRARPGAAPYATSKSALEAATRAAALELGPHGIRVNAVAPGFVEVGSSVNPVTDEYAAAVGDTPLGRRGRPDDIARAVVWIAGDEAEWVTGTVLRVDGGSSTGAWNLPQHWESISIEESGE